MIKQENPNFVASFYAPNPMEVTYWIDLSEDANGTVIKTYDGKKWIPLDDQVRQAIDNKANKSDVYTKSEANNKINTAVANKVTSTDVTQIKVVNEIPEVGSQTPGILYIKLSA